MMIEIRLDSSADIAIAERAYLNGDDYTYNEQSYRITVCDRDINNECAWVELVLVGNEINPHDDALKRALEINAPDLDISKAIKDCRLITDAVTSYILDGVEIMRIGTPVTSLTGDNKLVSTPNVWIKGLNDE